MIERGVLITGDFEIPDYLKSDNVKHLKAPLSSNEIIKHLKGVQHYIVGGPEFIDDKIMSEAQHLKHIVVMGTGISSFIDLEAAKKRQIKVDNTPGINSDSVAEFALASIIFNLANAIHSRDFLMKGGWYQKPHKTLSEVKMGIIGLGNIGVKLIRKIQAISNSTELFYFSKNRKKDLEEELKISYKNLEEIALECDVIVLCLTYNEDTHHIINSNFMNTVKEGLYLFNFSNPQIVDPYALKSNLKSGKINLAFFDGYYQEWINNKGKDFDHFGLLNLGSDKYIATSHIAAQSERVISKIILAAFEKIELWRAVV